MSDGQVSISAIVPSFNHGRYVVDAIESVLGQTLPPSQVVVVDDGSDDDSVRKISSIDDPRIQLIRHSPNRGGAAALNTGIHAAAGDYVAICNSDDLWEPKKLERQIEVLQRNSAIAAVFTNVSWIGPRGEPRAWHADVFNQPNRTRFEWIRHLLEGGNSLCHPSVLIRSWAYRAVGEYDNRFRQMPDYRMWLNLLRQFNIHVLNERLVRFRLHGANTSQRTRSTSARDRNECALIWEDLFEELDVPTFRAAFGTKRDPGDSGFNIEVEKILYLWTVRGRISIITRNLANRTAMRLLRTDKGLKAWESYGFSLQDFHRLHGMGSPWVARQPRPSDADLGLLARIGSTSHLLSAAGKLKREFLRIGRQLSQLTR